jgi:hypothetical protein
MRLDENDKIVGVAVVPADMDNGADVTGEDPVPE